MMNESSRPTKPTTIRIQPTVWMSMALLVSVTANARIAPAVTRIRLTGMPIRKAFPLSCPS
jgi:hypothetical protein